MPGKTKIEWATDSWNPISGCTKVSAGCKYCYAERTWARLSANPKTVYYGRKFTDVQCHPERLEQPLRWKKPRRIFVNSMSDLFHEDVPDEFIQEIFAVMALADKHIFQVLTKRPERMRGFMENSMNAAMVEGRAQRRYNEMTGDDPSMWMAVNFPLPNVWLGVSIENQETADERIPLLLETPAAVRWLSIEPLLGPVHLDKLREQHGGQHRNSLTGGIHGFYTNYKNCSKLDWVVVGGESGPKARPMHPAWVGSLRDQCQAADVPFFFKQWGEFVHRQTEPNADRQYIETDDGWFIRVGKKNAGRILDGRTWDEYPTDEYEHGN